MSILRSRLDATSTTLATKPNYRRWWHAVAAWIASALLTIVGRDFSTFWTTLSGTIYAPEGHDIDLEKPSDYVVVCHELAHRYDDRTHGWWYRISYIVSRRWRAHWEMRGYGMQMLAAARKRGRIPKGWVDRFTRAISGPAYLWAADEQTARTFFDRLREALESGELEPDFLDPSHDDFEQLLPD